MTTVSRPETEVVRTDKAAAPIGPYSQAIVANGFVFVAGEKGFDPAAGRIVPGGIAAETRRTPTTIKHILEAVSALPAGARVEITVHPPGAPLVPPWRPPWCPSGVGG